MKWFLILSLLLIGTYGFTQHSTCSHNALKSAYKSSEVEKRSDTTDVLNYSVFLDFTQAESDLIKANCKITYKAKMAINSISLDLQELTIDSIKHASGTLTYSYNDTLLITQIPSLLSDEIDSLTVYYHGNPVQDPSGLGGYYKVGGYYFNLGVGIDAIPHTYGRVWHPCFDNFSERATYTFEILTNAGKKAYCNGAKTNEISVGADSLITTWVLSTEIPSYLAAFAVADYTHVSANYYSVLQDENFPLWLISKASDTSNFKASFVNLTNAIAAFETHFGPYVWQKIGYVAVPFSSGALEHATMVAYPLITVNGSLSYEGLMAHELAHSWWGNWVTTASADEMWINEGMATYCELLFEEWIYDYDAYLSLMRDYHYDALRNAHFDDEGHYALDAMPSNHTYGTHTYIKGADMVHTLRSYMGDLNFFNALKEIQNNFGGGNISTLEMRDFINSLGTINVTDFFNDWISQPGYAHFAVIRFESEVAASGYEVKVLIDQKLRFANHFCNNVPLKVTFMNDNWELHEEVISFSGDYAVHTFNVPFNPTFVALNLDEKISDATTATTETINSVGNKLYNYSNIRINVTSISDSALLRVEHNWVYPDANGLMENVQLSTNRYWNIHGIHLSSIAGTMRFEYNGGTGNLDNELMVDLGGQPFVEDSLLLLFRENADDNWMVHPNYTQTFLGSNTDKFGYFNVNEFRAGQYAFGYKTTSVGLNEFSGNQTLLIYPNPANDLLYIDLTASTNKPLTLEIYAIDGTLIKTNPVMGGQITPVNTQELIKGNYILLIKDNLFTVTSKKVIIL